VALEAQACGTPVIAASVGGLRFTVEDGASGFLVCGHDPGDYADRLRELLSDPVTSARLRAGALRQAKRFSWAQTAAGVLGVYRELVA